jgi:hypothetical protein
MSESTPVSAREVFSPGGVRWRILTWIYRPANAPFENVYALDNDLAVFVGSYAVADSAGRGRFVVDDPTQPRYEIPLPTDLPLPIVPANIHSFRSSRGKSIVGRKRRNWPH